MSAENVQQASASTVFLSWRYYAGVFLVAAATLMLQVTQVRILSVMHWYHMAFFAIGIAMLGMTAGAAWVYVKGERFSETTLSRDLVFFGNAFGLSVLISLAIQLTLAYGGFVGSMTIVYWFVLSLLLSTPFFFSGIAISLALTRSPFPVGKVYAADMIGAAAGCLGFISLINVVDGPSAVILVGAVAAGGAMMFDAWGGPAPTESGGPAGWLLNRPKAVLSILLLVATGNAALLDAGGLRPIVVKGRIEVGETAPASTHWNAFSRVAVFPETEEPAKMWGPSRAFRGNDWIVPQRMINIDGDAETPIYGVRGDPSKAGFLRYDVTSLAYHLKGLRRGAIIGSGGGRDVLAARLFGVSDITGIEINPVLVRLLTRADGFAEFSGLGDMTGVRFFVDEARSWFARSNETFDIIQMSLVDTWAATGAGAFALTENGLYTIEAWRLLFRHLSDNGFFTVSRWRLSGTLGQSGRMVSLAMAVLMAEGVSHPARHIFLAHNAFGPQNVATLIVSRNPFTRAQLDRLRQAAENFGFEILADPSRPVPSPRLRGILSSTTADELQAFTSRQPLDLTPPTDSRPFFFNVLTLRGAVTYLRSVVAGGSTWIPGEVSATVTLVILFVISVILVIVAILVPLKSAMAAAGRPVVIAGTAYFLLLGAGFMLIEIGLMQRFTVFLGHRTYSLGITLSALILSTGVGSLLSHRRPLEGSVMVVGWALATAAYAAAMPIWMPAVLGLAEPLELLPRALIVMASIAPAGLLMGYGFPTGMRLVMAVDARPAPWFWGLNGSAGVLATSVGVGTSVAFGIDATQLVGATFYALIAVPAVMMMAPGIRQDRPRQR